MMAKEAESSALYVREPTDFAYDVQRGSLKLPVAECMRGTIEEHARLNNAPLAVSLPFLPFPELHFVRSSRIV